MLAWRSAFARYGPLKSSRKVLGIRHRRLLHAPATKVPTANVPAEKAPTEEVPAEKTTWGPTVPIGPTLDTSELDHRKLAKRQNVYLSTDYNRGSPLFYPEGAHILLKLQDFLRAQYATFGYQEVVTPVIYKQSLWERTGHWEKYADSMYEVVGRGATGETEGREKGEDEKFGLKPMNCPGHCLLFAAKPRPAASLPVRFADFGPLHRNEASGTLTGLTRLRRFHQDDGHIFCREDQIGSEIKSTLQLVDRIYKAFHLGPYRLVLSTKPEHHYIGRKETWERAEAHLKMALEANGVDWEVNPGDGAFYGPKIDIILTDRKGKEHQTATIQLDFNLPRRFDLEFIDQIGAFGTTTGPKMPVLIHRAVLGSLERFLALLLDQNQGWLPLWLSPRQVRVMTVHSDEESTTYAEEVAAELRGYQPAGDGSPLQPLGTERLMVETDCRSTTLAKKLKAGLQEFYRIYVTIGHGDIANRTLTVNFRFLSRLAPVADELERMGIAMPFNNDEEPLWNRVPMTVAQLRELLLRLVATYQ